MTPLRNVLDYLKDILENAQLVSEFTDGLTEMKFRADVKSIYAVSQALTRIGEAASKVPIEKRQEYPEVPWHAMIGLRHRIVHDYTGLNLSVMWNTAVNSIPRLIDPVSRAVAQELLSRRESR